MACFFIAVIIYVLCFQVFWVQLNIGLSLPESTKIFLGMSLFAIHLIISTVALYYSISRDGMSLRIIYWFYSFVFMGVAPLIQGAVGVWRHGFDPSLLLTLSLILLIAHISFIAGYTPGSHRWRRLTLN
ncbi:MAG: hypothetical protein VW418_07020, partial [Gammaproteobacteria bacterium]